MRLPGYVAKSSRRRPLTSTEFKRVGYWIPSNPSLVLIHYLGDDNIYKPIPHDNSNHENEHRQTMPSVLEKETDMSGGPKQVYINLVCTDIVDNELQMQGVANPRNTRQIKYVQGKVREGKFKFIILDLVSIG